jgi:ComF family protein
MLAWLENFLHLVYPPLCAGCGVVRPIDRHIFCLDCLSVLPETGYHQFRENPFTARFAGRIQLQGGAAFLYFSRGGGTQHLLHLIKYHNRPDLINIIGRWYGKQLATCENWRSAELILPVPLHWKKQRKRGYNQSAIFADALSEVLQIPCRQKILVRRTHGQSLTGMSRLGRVATVSDAYAITKPEVVNDKHVLLVDDVLTTGATLEACALVLLDAGASAISMVTIACGEL